ncbi:MAG: glutamyl-tRNA reductase [Verrucomicrobiales bacterium]|nr:glutamyl-tRNA reductase [Verrucomicrobiales bacterium]MDC0066397.1 glutamyl-tRNA reductase [Verrucomicrobiota bacterium]
MSEVSSGLEIFCIGLNHEAAPVSVRERMAIPETELAERCSLLTKEEGFYESVIVSTCNRIEIYCVADEKMYLSLEKCFEISLKSGDFSQLDNYKYKGKEVMRHLCRVASGLDSMVLGETEIFGQLKKAYSVAQSSDNTSKVLNKLFQSSFMIAKNVRTNSKITRGATSVGAAGVDLAEKIFGDLKRCNVMVIGTGEMGQIVAKTLIGRGVKSLEVVSRSLENATQLAKEMGGTPYQLNDGISRLSIIDILITATSSPTTILHKNMVDAIFNKRRGRPLFIVDIAVPRDVDEEITEIPGVYLYDMDALQRITSSARTRREEQIEICENLILQLIRSHSFDESFKNSSNFSDDGSDPVTTV